MIIRFITIDPDGQYHEFTLGSVDLETSFESLTEIVRKGWQLCQVKLIDPPSSSIYLPIAAFDGGPFLGPISVLQCQWEALLAFS